jgi:hypothetical protein
MDPTNVPLAATPRPSMRHQKPLAEEPQKVAEPVAKVPLDKVSERLLRLKNDRALRTLKRKRVEATHDAVLAARDAKKQDTWNKAVYWGTRIRQIYGALHLSQDSGAHTDTIHRSFRQQIDEANKMYFDARREGLQN